MLSSEEKNHFSKIKKLITQRDFDKIEMGIDLIRSLNNANIFNEFLKNVKYVSDQWRGNFTHDWKGAGPDQHYFNTAILGLINFSPEGSFGFEIRKSVNILLLQGEIESGYSKTTSYIYCKYISNFKNLKTLILKNFREIKGFEAIYDLPIEGLQIDRVYGENFKDGVFPNTNEKWEFKNLKTLHINLTKHMLEPGQTSTSSNIKVFDNINFISELDSIENLSIIGRNHEQAFSIDGLKNFLKLKYLKTSGLGYANVDALCKLKNLNYVKLSEDNLNDVSGLTNSENLEFIDLSSSKKLDNIIPLRKLKNIKLIDISYTQVNLLNGLENSVNIHGVKAVNTPIKNLDGLVNAKNIYCIDAEGCKHLENIEGIKNSVKLKEIILDYCSSLVSLNGIENCKDIRVIKLSGSGISNLDSLTNCKNIFNNNKTKWDEETDEWSGDTGSQNNPFWGITESIDKVGYGNLYQAKYIGEKCREYYPDRDWSEPTLNEFIISDCPNLENINGLKNIGIQLLILKNCPKIINPSLSEFYTLQCVDFENCSSLASVEALTNLPIDRLFLGKCYKVKPKPRFLKMDSVEKVTEYFSKFKKSEKKTTVSNVNKEIIDKLKKLIISDNYEEINLGLDLASTISEIEIFDYFLDGIKFNGEKILPNPIFLAGTKKLEEFREFALRGMVSISPDGCKHADIIKSQITQTSISGSKYTSLFLVSGLTKLESLTVEDTSITLISDLSRLKNLKKLILKANLKLENLEGIKTLKSIEEIHILPKESWGLSSPIIDLNGISELKNLKVLKIYNCKNLLSLGGLENLNSLQVFDLRKCQKLHDINSLSDLKSLNNISLRECESVLSIKCLEQLPNLKLLDIRFHNISDSEELSKLSKPIIESLRSGTLTF